MNHPIRYFEKNTIPFFSALAFLLVSIIACNENDEKSSSDTEKPSPTPTDASQTTVTNTAAAVNIEEFPVLCISKDDIDKLFNKRPNEPAVAKLMFIFTEDGGLLNPTLTPFRAKNNSKILGGAETPLLRNENSDQINGDYKMGNLELTEATYKRIKKLDPENKAKRLLFYPIVERLTRSVSYVLRWDKDDCSVIAPGIVGAQPTDQGDLNPCPPNQPGQGN